MTNKDIYNQSGVLVDHPKDDQDYYENGILIPNPFENRNQIFNPPVQEKTYYNKDNYRGILTPE